MTCPPPLPIFCRWPSVSAFSESPPSCSPLSSEVSASFEPDAVEEGDAVLDELNVLQRWHVDVEQLQ